MLAIGIVVDDAIVVVEAVEHHIEPRLKPRDATIRRDGRVCRPVIAIGLVLSAVFVPCAFITGVVGQFFRQFALTIATSTIISAFNSLTLSPALAAMLLKPRVKGARHNVLPVLAFVLFGAWLGSMWLGPWLAERYPRVAALHIYAGPAMAAGLGALLGGLVARPLNAILAFAFRLFNLSFVFTTGIYTRMVAGMLRLSILVLMVYGGLLGLTYWGFSTTPTGFIPSQDMGYLLVNVQLPDSASLERSQEAMDHIEKIGRQTEGIKFTQVYDIKLNSPFEPPMARTSGRRSSFSTHTMNGPIRFPSDSSSGSPGPRLSRGCGNGSRGPTRRSSKRRCDLCFVCRSRSRCRAIRLRRSFELGSRPRCPRR